MAGWELNCECAAVNGRCMSGEEIHPEQHPVRKLWHVDGKYIRHTDSVATGQNAQLGYDPRWHVGKGSIGRGDGHMNPLPIGARSDAGAGQIQEGARTASVDQCGHGEGLEQDSVEDDQFGSSWLRRGWSRALGGGGGGKGEGTSCIEDVAWWMRGAGQVMWCWVCGVCVCEQLLRSDEGAA
jgi:hypothetical protein